MARRGGGGIRENPLSTWEAPGLIKIPENRDFDPPFLQKDMTQGGLAEKKVPRRVRITLAQPTVAFFSSCPPFSGHKTQLV